MVYKSDFTNQQLCYTWEKRNVIVNELVEIQRSSAIKKIQIESPRMYAHPMQ